LAAKKPTRLLNDLNTSIDDFLCRVLRGESAPWSVLDAKSSPEEFLLRCQHQGVSSLLYHAMQQQEDWLSWPAKVRSGLDKITKTDLAQEMLRAHHLQNLLNSFSDQGVPCLLMKGEALANTLYPIPGTRTRCDSDLFIPINAIGNACRSIADAGFAIISPIYKSHQFTVRKMGVGGDLFEFDVHWRLLNAPRFARALSFEEAYEHSIEVSGMESARTLNPLDTLLLACLHRVGSDSHDRDRLIWLYDMHLLASVFTPERHIAFADKALKLQVQAECLDGLRRSQACFVTDIPGEMMARLDSPEQQRSMSRRFQESNLGLLFDDWKCLPDRTARHALIKELFLPNSESLLKKYGKEGRRWLPLLYLRHILGGLTQRLMLR
jgi:hypothetical protein